MHARHDRIVALRLEAGCSSDSRGATRAERAPRVVGSLRDADLHRTASMGRRPSAARDDALDRALHDVWLGSIHGSRRFICTGIAAAAGVFLTVWIALLWLMTWLLPAVF